MTRRTALWITGIAALVLGAVLLAPEATLFDEGGPGIVGFELAGTEERARDIRVEWGPDGRDAARLSLWLDYAYLVAYGAFLALASLATRDRARREGWTRLAGAGSTMAVLAVAAALFDAIEDAFLLLALGGHGGGTAPALAAAAAGAKFLCLAVVIVYLLVGLFARARVRFGRAAPIALGALVLAAAALLAVNAVTVGGETRTARADGGRILSLPGGDVHVREDGDPRRPPLVLVHGFASSVRWWDRVVPALAREHRVIRVDLLGHGGSEKPEDGYGMEDQADLVAAAMRRLGVRRAAVVGHSMGGIVGTALVERHRDMVTRLMTIGTPPDTDSSKPGLVRQAASAPVIGPALRTLLPRTQVRAEVERSAVVPRVDVPDRLVDDVERTTFTSFRDSGDAAWDYREEATLDARLSDEDIPLTAVVGAEDALVEPAGVERFRRVPGARVVRLPGRGHTPQVEAPAATARLILAFAREGRPSE